MNSTTMNNMTGIVKAPGNDSLGSNCLTGNSLPAFENLLPRHGTFFVSGLSADGTYNATAWSLCCARHELSLALSCYPYCEIPPETLRDGKDKSRIGRDMARCIGNTTLSGVWVNQASPASSVGGLTKALAVGMMLAYILM